MDIFENLSEDEQHLVVNRLSTTILKMEDARATKLCQSECNLLPNLKLASGKSFPSVPSPTGRCWTQSDPDPRSQSSTDTTQFDNLCQGEIEPSFTLSYPSGRKNSSPSPPPPLNRIHMDQSNVTCTVFRSQQTN